MLQNVSDMTYNEVMPRSSTLEKIADLAEEQWGFITRRQANAAGVSPSTLNRLIRDGALERTSPSVYHLAGAPEPDHAALRSAWLQLEPDVPAWRREAIQGVVSHRSAAALFGFGHLPADSHEFIVPKRRQTRRKDVRLHKRVLDDQDWIILRGLPVTRPSRIVSDLLSEHEDPEAIGQIIADALRGAKESPHAFVQSLGPQAARLGLRAGDGLAALSMLLDLIGDDSDLERWLDEARRTPGSSWESDKDRLAGALTRSMSA